MSNKMWDVLVEHAKTCVLSGKLYVYYPDDIRTVGIVFNNIYELSGLIANGEYYAAESLSDNQKVNQLAVLICILFSLDFHFQIHYVYFINNNGRLSSPCLNFHVLFTSFMLVGALQMTLFQSRSLLL